MSDQHEHITYHTPCLTIAFSRGDGSLCQLQRVGGENILGHGIAIPGVDVALGEYGWLSDYTFARYLSHSWVSDGDQADLMIMTGLGPLKISDIYHIHKYSIIREVCLENVGLEPVPIHGVRLSIPWIRIAKLQDCVCEVPGSSVRPRASLVTAAEQRPNILPRRFFAPGLRDGRAIEAASTNTPGIMAVRNRVTHETLVCWFINEDHAVLPEIEGNDTAVSFHYTVEYNELIHVASDLIPRDPGRVCMVGKQHMLLSDRAWPESLAEFRSSWLLAHRPPRTPVAWLRDAAIYETHPGLAGGIDGLIASLPSIAQLGITVLCLLPIWSYGSGPHAAWDGLWYIGEHPYALRDLSMVDSSVGSNADILRLVSTAHDLGLRVIADLPLIGFSPESRYAFNNPDWGRRDMYGRPVRLADIGALAFNWSNAELCSHIVDQAIDHVRRFELDGLRLITPRIMQPNWAVSAHTRVSSGDLGYARVAAAIQRRLEAMSVVGAERVLLGDMSGPQGVFLLQAAMDELVQHMFVHTALNRLTPEELGFWLQDHLAALPYAQLRISFSESHRSHVINPLAIGLRGSRINRMLLAGLVLCGFIPLIWFGQEDDEGVFIRRLLHIRQEHEVLRSGLLYFNTVGCTSPHVFTVLRSNADVHVLGLLNFDSRKQAVTLQLPLERMNLTPGAYYLRTIFAANMWGEELEQQKNLEDLLPLEMILNPYDVLFLEIEKVVNEGDNHVSAYWTANVHTT